MTIEIYSYFIFLSNKNLQKPKGVGQVTRVMSYKTKLHNILFKSWKNPHTHKKKNYLEAKLVSLSNPKRTNTHTHSHTLWAHAHKIARQALAARAHLSSRGTWVPILPQRICQSRAQFTFIVGSTPSMRYSQWVSECTEHALVCGSRKIEFCTLLPP